MADPRTRSWRVVAGLFIAVFLARAPLYLAVFPPFEGWDEYQHLGYIAYLDQTGRPPVFGSDTRVPFTLRPLVISLPHSRWGGDQVKEWGALSYPEFWTGSPPNTATARGVLTSPRLYQAQHPPLAYALDLPIWRTLHGRHPLDAIYAIRALNLLLVAGALVVFAAALERLVPAFGPRVTVLALVCLHPLFFQNVARVANDGLAVAAGMVGISLLALADDRTLMRRSVWAAASIAVGVWSKQTGLTLIPALVIGVPLMGWSHGASRARVWRATVAALTTFLVLVAPLWWWSYAHYGSVVTTQESIQLAADRSGLAALVQALSRLRWGSLIDTLFVPGRPWVGGWSFIPMQTGVASIHAWYWSALVVLALVGGVMVACRRAVSHVDRATPVGDTAGLWVCGVVVVFTILGLVHHAVSSTAAFGQPMTNPWYFMTAFPFVLVLLVRGLEAIDRRLAVAGGVGLAALFVVMDVYGTWVAMPRVYADTTDRALQWTRLSSIHPAALAGDWRYVFLAAQAGAMALAIASVIRLAGGRPARS